MTKPEFARLMAIMSAAIGKPMAKEQAEVYFECLGDLSHGVLSLAVKRVLLEHQISTLPTIAELRRLAVEIERGPQLSAVEAFALARKAVVSYGVYQKQKGIDSLPPEVASVACHLWETWCDSDNEDAIRARFIQAWDRQAEHGRREALLPAPLKQAIEAVAAPRIAEQLAARLALPPSTGETT